MIYCLSCDKYPRDSQQPSVNVYRVRLFSSTTPSPLPSSGADVIGLADSTQFSVGSKLYVSNGDNGTEIYVYDSTQFVLWCTNAVEPTPSEDNTSDIVDVGEVDYMILTA